MQLKIKSALVCDLVRVENTGKHIIIGVYTGDIVFGERPGRIIPTFWIELVPFIQGGTMNLEARVDTPAGKAAQRADISLPVTNEKMALLIISTKRLEITRPGFLRLSLRPKNGRRWTNVLSKEVQFLDSLPPSA